MGKVHSFKGLANTLALFLTIFCLSNCGGKSDSGEPDAKAPIGNIQIDPYISQAHRDAMAVALSNLDATDSWSQDGHFTTLMHIPTISAQTLHGWLEDRVQYILGSSFDVNNRIYVAQQNYFYENPGEMPSSDGPPHRLEDAQVQTLGLNVGTQIYLVGKKFGELIGVHISRIGSVTVTSPRTGLIQIGEGAFFRDPNNPAAQIYLMSILFHEARHADGHGQSAGFTHSICPSGHVYAGYAACDNNSNGPYTVQEQFVRQLAMACVNCSKGQQEFFKNVRADFLSRVVGTYDSQGQLIPPANWDDLPEGHR